MAMALLLVLEGVLPFLSPSATRKFARMFESVSDLQIRVAGFVAMLSGLALLLVVR